MINKTKRAERSMRCLALWDKWQDAFVFVSAVVMFAGVIGFMLWS